MFELQKINEGLYQIHAADSHFNAKEGTLLAISVYMHKLGFPLDEVEKALVSMLRNNHNSAGFNGDKTFAYSFKQYKRSA